MRKLNVTIFIGVLVAIVGFGLVFAYGSNVDSRVADGKKTQDVLVADSTLAPGATPSQIQKSIHVEKIPTAYLAEGSLANLDGVRGQVLLGPVGAGGQLTRSLFGQPLDAGAVKPSADHVALAVGADLSPGVARYLTPGSIVDVFATYAGGGQGTAKGSNGNSSTAGTGKIDPAGRTKLFVSGVTILSVTVGVPPKGADKDTAATNSGATTQVIVLLDVTPVEAEKIVNVQQLGQIYFALSSADGKKTVHQTRTGADAVDVENSNK